MKIDAITHVAGGYVNVRIREKDLPLVKSADKLLVALEHLLDILLMPNMATNDAIRRAQAVIDKLRNR